MSSEARLVRLGLSHLKGNPEELLRALLELRRTLEAEIEAAHQALLARHQERAAGSRVPRPPAEQPAGMQLEEYLNWVKEYQDSVGDPLVSVHVVRRGEPPPIEERQPSGTRPARVG